MSHLAGAADGRHTYMAVLMKHGWLYVDVRVSKSWVPQS